MTQRALARGPSLS